MTNSITVTIPNPTQKQIAALAEIIDTRYLVDETTTPAKKTKSRKAPAKTVSEDEDEDYGTEEMEEGDEDLEGDDEEEEVPLKKKATSKKKAAVVEEEDEDEEEADEDGGLDWDEVRDAMNTYGEKNKAGMKAILAGVNVKTTKELMTHKNKWEPVYRKVMAKLKALKKK